MRFNVLNRGLSLLFLVSIAFGQNTTFQARPVSEYPHKQTSEKVTIAVEQFITDDQTKDAFGKVNPWRLGILPVLVVIQNDSAVAVRIDRIQFTYILPDRSKVEATPAAELRFLKSFKPPTNNPQFPKIPGLGGKNKNPLAGWEIEGRALSAKMIPPGQSASGFVYFQIPNSSAASTLYVSGLINAISGAELYYFEVPL